MALIKQLHMNRLANPRSTLGSLPESVGQAVISGLIYPRVVLGGCSTCCPAGCCQTLRKTMFLTFRGCVWATVEVGEVLFLGLAQNQAKWAVMRVAGAAERQSEP